MSTKVTFQEIVACLLHSRNQAHVYHWQTKGVGSNAQHLALGEYYESIIDLVDNMVETYQGKYDIVTGYNQYLKEYTLNELENNASVYFDLLVVELEKYKAFFTDTWMINIFDTIIETAYKTKYKLDNLQ